MLFTLMCITVHTHTHMDWIWGKCIVRMQAHSVYSFGDPYKSKGIVYKCENFRGNKGILTNNRQVYNFPSFTSLCS